MIPRAFNSGRALQALNVVGVGVSLAAIGTTTLLALLFHTSRPTEFVLAALPPTFVLGALWAALFRRRQIPWLRRVRLAWLAAIPFACLNAILTDIGLEVWSPSVHLSLADGSVMRLAFSVLGIASIGAIFWGPACLVTLLFFGVPLFWAERAAEKGMTGSDRGEFIVGLCAMAMSAVSFALVQALGPSWFAQAYAPDAMADVLAANQVMSLWSALGMALGCTSALLAAIRLSQRRAFVTRVEAGAVAGYRIAETDDGKVLLRILEQTEVSYRVAAAPQQETEEPLFELGSSGESLRAFHVREPKRSPA
jgi:hypothetical protein